MKYARLLSRSCAWVCVTLLGCVAPDGIGFEYDDGVVGTISQPLSFIPSLPFPKGLTATVSQGWDESYSHTGNLKYAIDFAGIGGKHVLAVGDGTVVYTHSACAASSPGCNFGWGNAVIVDHGDGVFSKCTHLYPDSIPSTIAVSTKVCRGAVLGVVGTSGNSSGNHIHFQLQNVGGINSPSIPFDRFQETTGIPKSSDKVTSQNEEGASCGSVPPEEKPEEKPEEEKECTVVIGATEVIIEENSPCVNSGGALTDEQGHAGHAYSFVQEHKGANFDKGITWMLHFSAAGRYKLSVYIPAGVGDRSPGAIYKIAYGGGNTKIALDQSKVADSWADLGTFDFAAKVSQYVRVGNNYEDPSAQGKRVAADALRITPVSACACSGSQSESRDCPGGGTQSRTCDGCNWTAWSLCPGGGSGGSGGSDGSSADGGPIADAQPGAEAGRIGLVDAGRAESGGGDRPSDWSTTSDEGGCSCRAAGTAPRSIGAFASVLVVFAGWIARRKRRNV